MERSHGFMLSTSDDVLMTVAPMSRIVFKSCCPEVPTVIFLAPPVGLNPMKTAVAVSTFTTTQSRR